MRKVKSAVAEPVKRERNWKKSGPKILIFDIESAPILGVAWRKWESDLVWIESDWHLLSFSSKWLHGKQTTRALPDYPDYTPGSKDDKALATELWHLLDQADVVVGHNARAFDVKKANARFLKHGLPPVRDFKIVDTMLIARRAFSLTSNKLDDIAQYLGIGRKVATGGYQLWRDCMAGEPAAWRRMKKYNRGDTLLTEAVYLALRPWDKSHPNFNAMLDRPTGCPKCGHAEMERRGYGYTKTGRRPEFRCKKCGGTASGAHEKIAEMM